MLDELGLSQVDVDTEASELSVAERQLTEIARALVRDARLLILDEPSAVLAGPELDSLFASLRRLAAQGVAILFISHRLSDVMDLCDEITILRDGQLVSTGHISNYTTGRIIREMSGRALVELAPAEGAVGRRSCSTSSACFSAARSPRASACRCARARSSALQD